MNCQECESLFDDMIDGMVKGTTRKRMELHLSRCSVCGGEFAHLKKSHAIMMRALNYPDGMMHVPSGFADRLVEECRRHQPRWRQVAVPKWALIAASLVVMAGFTFAATVVGRTVLNAQDSEGCDGAMPAFRELPQLQEEGYAIAADTPSRIEEGSCAIAADTPARMAEGALRQPENQAQTADRQFATYNSQPTTQSNKTTTNNNQQNGENEMNIKQKTVAALAAATLSATPMQVTAVSGTIADTNVNDVLVVESGNSFEVTGNMSIATTAGATGKVENHGTMTVTQLDLGKYSASKGALAQFDNYGTLTIGTCLRMGVLGTPSIFYNHEGGTVTKGGSGDYTFYLGANTQYSVSTLISEGDFTFAGSPLRMAARDRTTNHVVLAKSGKFTANGYMRVGEQGYSYNTLTMKDNSLLTGGGGFAAPYAASGAERAQAYVTLSNNAAIVKSSGEFIIGGQKNGIGVMTLNDSSRVERTGVLDIGRADGATGRVELHDTSYLRATSYLNVGAAVAGTTGELEMTDSAQITNNVLIVGCMKGSRGTAVFGGNSHIENLSTAYIAHGSDSSYGSTGAVTFKDSATGLFKWYLNMGSGRESKGELTVQDNASVYVSSNLWIGANQSSTGIVNVAGNASLTVATNLVVGAAWKTTGELNIGGNAAVSALRNMTLGEGHTSVTRVTLADNAKLDVWPTLKIATNTYSYGHVLVSGGTLHSVSNYVAAYANSTGVLEVATGGLVTNVCFMQVGSSSAGASGLLKLSGGTVLFDPTYHKDYAPLYLNPPLSRSSGAVRGWGKVAFENPRTMVTEAEKPGGLIHYGQVVADGEGQMRDLDFGRFGAIPYGTTNPNPENCTNGWFAVNKGRLKLPRSLPRKTVSYNCVGDYWALPFNKEKRLANTFTYTLQGATLNNYMFAELYATDRDDIPEGLNSIGADRTLAVWRIGHFSDGPEIDEPEHPAAFTSATLRFRYATDPNQLAGMNYVRVYRHNGTANGSWKCVGRADVAVDNPQISAAVDAPSDANWNLGWFAVTCRANPMGTMFSIR